MHNDRADIFVPHDAVTGDESVIEVHLPVNSTWVLVVSMQVNILQCMFWSKSEELWKTRGCVVSKTQSIVKL